MRKFFFVLVIAFISSTAHLWAQSEAFIGEIRMFVGSYAPRGWALCNGQSLVIAQHSALFAVIGNQFGGTATTFNLPNLQGRIPIGMGSVPGLSPQIVGQTGGAERVTLGVSQIPAHSHSVTIAPPVSSSLGNSEKPTGNVPAVTGDNNYQTTSNATGASYIVTSASSGGSQPVSIMPPTLCVNFIIALEGIFPTQE